MNKLVSISPSPHVHDGQSVNKLMYSVVIAMVPALAWSVYAFGFGAIIVTLVSIVSCLLFEYLIQKFILKSPVRIGDGSALVTGILLAFNLPSTLPWWIIVIGALVSIGIGKLTFGGLGNNPFNPALVGRVFLLISFPVPMTSYPKALGFATPYVPTDDTTGPTPLGLIKEGIKQGESIKDLMQDIPSYGQMLMGELGGSLGEITAFFLVIGGLYMIIRKTITWHIPVSVLGSVILLTGALWLINDQIYMPPFFHLLTGGLMLGAIFMATDYVTSPMTGKAQLIYGCGIGLITVIIRVWGAYPEGISFAILIMNAFVPLLNRYIKPKKFGQTK